MYLISAVKKVSVTDIIFLEFTLILTPTVHHRHTFVLFVF